MQYLELGQNSGHYLEDRGVVWLEVGVLKLHLEEARKGVQHLVWWAFVALQKQTRVDYLGEH